MIATCLRGPLRLIALCFVALAARVQVAEAEEAVAPAQVALSTQAAQAHYEAGSVYYEQGKYERAAEEFLLAQRDDDRPALDYNIGVCWGKLGDAVRAAAAYRRFLARSSQTDKRAELEATIATLEARTGELVLRTRVSGARLTLDNRAVDAGVPVRVNTGAHELGAAKEGYRSATASITIAAGAHEEASLDPIASKSSSASRRRALAIGFGVGGAVIVGTAVALGVVFGTRGFDTHPTSLGPIVVRP